MARSSANPAAAIRAAVAANAAVAAVAAITAIAAIAAITPGVAHAQASTAGWIESQSIQAPSALVDGTQFARRLLSPLSSRDVNRFLDADGRKLKAEPFAPGDYTVSLYVPRARPPAGYGLLVFVPPMDEFAIPPAWQRVFERRGILFVQLHGVGNDASVFGRRIPAVLHAYSHATATFGVDPARRYVGGFSGGARVAQRVALAWPDEFRGSLQFAGSVPIGESLLPPPERALLDRARSGSRFVLVSGSQDMPNRSNDAQSMQGFDRLCFEGVSSLTPSRLDHWVPDARGLDEALDLLEAPVAPSSAADACRRRLDGAVSQALDAVETRLGAGELNAARDGLVRLDDSYGGLAAPRSLELARRIEAALARK